MTPEESTTPDLVERWRQMEEEMEEALLRRDFDAGMGFFAPDAVTVEKHREIDARRVLVLLRFSGRGRASGLEIGSMSTRNAAVYDIDGGLVRRLALYWDRDRAFAELGLGPEAGSP